MRRIIVLSLLGCSISACSNQQVYSAIQENRKQECMKLPVSEHEACLRDFTHSYDEYEQERKKLNQHSY